MPSRHHHTTRHCHCLYMHFPQRQLYTMMTKDRFGGTTTTPSATVSAPTATPLQSQSLIISTTHATAVTATASNTTQAPTLATMADSNSSSISNNATTSNRDTISTIQQSTKSPPATLSLLTSATTPTPTLYNATSVSNPVKSPAGGGLGKR